MPMANPTSQAKHHHPAHAHERQASAAEPSQAPVPAGTIYTCPMHPQIRQVGPGHCPICGMALEPELAGEAGPNPELVDMTRRFWIGLVLSIPVVALEMGGHLANLHMLLGGNLSNRGSTASSRRSRRICFRPRSAARKAPWRCISKPRP